MFLDMAQLLVLMEREGVRATPEQIHHIERRGREKLDAWLLPQLRRGGIPEKIDVHYWTSYLDSLVEELRVPTERRLRITQNLLSELRNISLWTWVEPETGSVLERLRRAGYVLGVISNSSGTLEEHIRRWGLADYFDVIVDSAVVGTEKPDPKIFRLAAEKAGVAPADSAYLGDTYSIDVFGARSAGLTPLLLDRLQMYAQADCQRITHIRELEDLVAELA